MNRFCWLAGWQVSERATCNDRTDQENSPSLGQYVYYSHTYVIDRLFTYGYHIVPYRTIYVGESELDFTYLCYVSVHIA